MSSFKSKAAVLKSHLSQQPACQHPHQIQVLRDCSNPNSQELSLQQPIIIERKTIVKEVKEEASSRKVKTTGIEAKTRRKVEQWMPISVPVRQKKVDLDQMHVTTAPSNKQIEINIEKDDKDKDCLKKLFKKIHKLQEELKESEKERIRLNLELENYKGRSRVCNEHEKVIGKLEGEKYRLEVDLDMANKLLKERQAEIQRLIARAPKETIKEVIIEKPVQVIVEVPRNVPGPERIVERIVEVPKYIEVEKKVPVEVIKEVTRDVIRTVEVPTIIEKPIYIDKPVYIDRPVEVQRRVEVPVEVRVEVPVEYPVYIDKPIVEEEWLIKIRDLQGALQNAFRDNSMMASENGDLRIRVSQLAENLELMRRHNEDKNRQVQMLLQNSMDYLPFSPHQDASLGSVKYSISSNPHPRLI